MIEEKSYPRVVACVPAYNAEGFIERMLGCLKNQTYPNLKILVSDDSSSDDTAALISSFIRDDDRFIFIQQTKNLGWVTHVNTLMKVAVKMGKYAFIAPHDDEIAIDYVQKLTLALENNPSAVIAFSDIKTISPKKSKTLSFTTLDGITDKMTRLKLILNRKEKSWIAYRGLTRTEVIKKIIPLRKNLFGKSEFSLDRTWLAKIIMYGECIRVPEFLYTKHYHEANLSESFQGFWKDVIYLATYSNMLLASPLSIREQIKIQFSIFVRMIVITIYKSARYFYYRTTRFPAMKRKN